MPLAQPRPVAQLGVNMGTGSWGQECVVKPRGMAGAHRARNPPAKRKGGPTGEEAHGKKRKSTKTSYIVQLRIRDDQHERIAKVHPADSFGPLQRAIASDGSCGRDERLGGAERP